MTTTHDSLAPASDAEQLGEFVAASIGPDSNLVLPIANGEPPSLIRALTRLAGTMSGVRIHQMHAMRDHPYIHGSEAGCLEHVSWFLSPVTRTAYAAGHCSMIPANFSEMPDLLANLQPEFVLAAATPPDRHGWFSLGLNADYVAPLIGRVPFVIETLPDMPRTFGGNSIHLRDVAGWTHGDAPLVAVDRQPARDEDRSIAALVAERIPNGATVQIGSGTSPRAVARGLRSHRELGIHTELFSDELMDLIESGAADGSQKSTHRGRAVATFALGSENLYRWLDHNPAVEFYGVDRVNDPRRIGREPHFVSVNGAIQVDLFGQCASETIGTSYHTGSGGQADFARGTMYSEGGQGFVVLNSTTREGRVSRVVPTLDNGAIVTTGKNTVDRVVTEHGVAELRGVSLGERARRLIGIADPRHRDWLSTAADGLGLRV